MTDIPGAAAPARPAPRVLRGILYMLAAATLFPVMSGFAKILSSDYASEQVIWARNAGHFVFVLALFAPRRGWSVFRANRLGAQIFRSVLLMVSTVFAFIGIKYIPLGQAAAIQFIAPFIVTLMAWQLLGERLVAARLVVIVIAFAGVLIVIRPGTEGFDWATLLPVGSSTFYAAYQVFTRYVADKDTPETSVVYSALVGTVAMAVFLPFVWKTPATFGDLVTMTSLGIIGGLGHYCIARAMQNAEASVLSPFNYWQLVGSSAFGLVMLGEWPDGFTWIGAGVIIAAGLMLWRLETRRGAGATTGAAPTSRA